MKRMLLGTLIGFGLLLPVLGNAVVVRVEGRVQATFVDTENFGGCMVLLDTQAEGNNCTTRWMTFSCDGAFGSAASGFKKLDTALVAQLTGNAVSAFVDDSRKANGHCYGVRIDLNTF